MSGIKSSGREGTSNQVAQVLVCLFYFPHQNRLIILKLLIYVVIKNDNLCRT